MKYQLITLNPLERASQAVGGFPPVREVAEGQEIGSPEGHAYVPVINKPEVPAGKKAVKKLTEESDGWELVDLSESETQKSKIEVTQLQLRLAILQTDILSLETLEQAIVSKGAEAQTRWNFAATIPIDHPLVLELAAALNLDDDEIEEIFLTAANVV